MIKLMADVAKKNNAEEAKVKKPSREAAAAEAAWLKKWSKGKPICRVSSDSSFWKAGKWMHKMSFKVVDALVEYGLAEISGPGSREGGCILKIK